MLMFKLLLAIIEQLHKMSRLTPAFQAVTLSEPVDTIMSVSSVMGDTHANQLHLLVLHQLYKPYISGQ